jgi:hypothetical protein
MFTNVLETHAYAAHMRRTGRYVWRVVEGLLPCGQAWHAYQERVGIAVTPGIKGGIRKREIVTWIAVGIQVWF